jgi:hypothetical protein
MTIPAVQNNQVPFYIIIFLLTHTLTCGDGGIFQALNGYVVKRV